ncbi:hypothetical protein BGZ76_003571 [Entomortierella beljakovae]|nr:hypothetical protein BGZ76_003571 [Entomortierella beljakovae]
MSRSSSVGSATRTVPMGHPKYGPGPGQTRPNLSGNPTMYKSDSNPYFTNGSVPPHSLPSPYFPSKLGRSSSAMAVSIGNNSSASSPYVSYTGDQNYGHYQKEQQEMSHSLPRPNMTRHESLGHHPSSRYGRHDHHRSLDIDPFSALSELANLAEQHRDLSKDDLDVDHHRHSEEDIEDTVMKTKIAKPNLARRFSSSLCNLKEEEHTEEQGYPRSQHSYHIDQSSVNHFNQGFHQRSSPPPHHPHTVRSSSAHGFYYSERSSGDYSGSGDEGSDREHENMSVGDDNRREHSPKPDASYFAMRRGSVRELMAIDNLCLSSDEVRRR